MAAPARAPALGRRWRYPYTGKPGEGPHPKQALAHQRWAHERLFGGAVGGGKSDWLLGEVLGAIFRWGVDGLLLRRTHPQLAMPGGIIERLLERIPRHVGRYNAQKHLWRFANGSLLQLGSLLTDGDVERYMGPEFGVIGLDQLEMFTEWQYRRLSHPLRVAAEIEAQGFIPFKVATANPGGVGHHWVKGRFIDPAPPGVVWQPAPTEEEPRPGSRCFIQSLLTDNPGLGPGYEAQLATLPEDDRRALLEGDWDVYAGAAFGNLWRRQVHVIEPEEYPIPGGGGVVRGLGIDYGLDAPFAAYWGAKFGDGLVVIYRELYKAGLSASQQALAIRAAEAPSERGPGRPVPAWIDPSTYARNPHDPQMPGPGHGPPTGSIAHAYVKAGVPVQRAHNDRLAGAGIVADKLRVRDDGWPRLLVYSTCVNLIRTLPGLPRDPKQPELVDTKGEDHAYDALRYLLLGLEGRATKGKDPGAQRPGPRTPTASGAQRPDVGRIRRGGF